MHKTVNKIVCMALLFWGFGVSAMEQNSFIETDDVGEQLVQAINNFKSLSFIEKLISREQDAYRKYPHLVYVAAKCGDVRVVKLLFDWGFDINKKKSRKTPLYAAVKRKNKKLVTFLLNHGADIRKGIKVYTPIKSNSKEFWESPLFCAIEDSSEAVTKLLLERGADSNSRKISGGETALMCAVRKGFDIGVDLLLKAGAAVNIIDDNGNTALSRALYYYTQCRIKKSIKEGICSDDFDMNEARAYYLNKIIERLTKATETDINDLMNKAVIDHLTEDIQKRNSVLNMLKSECTEKDKDDCDHD